MLYHPHYLDQQTLKTIYLELLHQAEQAELQAWVNYLRARAARQVVEEDLTRLTERPAT